MCRRVAASLAWFALCALTALDASALRVETIALSDRAAPGAAGKAFESFWHPVIDAAGRVAFVATLRNPGAPQQWGVWIADGLDLSLVALAGAQAPDVPPGAFFATFGDPCLGRSGVALLARLTGSGIVDYVNERGLWVGDVPGSLRLLARQGDPAPGAPTGGVFELSNYALPHDAFVLTNDAGDVTLRASLALGPGGVTEEDDGALWGPDGAGGLVLLAREGDQAPGAPAGTRFEHIGYPRLNELGQLAFPADLESSASGSASIFGPDATGALSLLATQGDPAPGIEGARFLAFSHAAQINDRAQVLFGAITDAGSSGIWRSDGAGNLQLVVRHGDPAPGVPGASFWNPDANLNGAGEVALSSLLRIQQGGVTTLLGSIWVPSPSGGWTLAALQGTQAPGLPEGVRFGTFDGYALLNDSGDVAFQTRLEPSGEASIFVVRSGVASPVLATGDLLEVAPGDVREVRGAEFQPFMDNRATFNDRGEIPAHVGFSDDSFAIVRIRTRPACSNGEDDDGDGNADFPLDRGCRSAFHDLESPECEDGLDNDGDGEIDWRSTDGVPADAACGARPWRNSEAHPSGCGLGFELAPCLLALLACRRWSARRSRQSSGAAGSPRR